MLVPITLATGIGASSPAWAADGGNSTAPPPAKMVQAVQKNLNFQPAEVILKPGDSVIWTNKEVDDTTHSVVQGNGADIDSPDMPPGQTFVWKFDKPGEWDMICRFHPAMYMTIGVVGKDGKVPPSAPYTPPSTLPANPTPPQGTVPGVAGLPIGYSHDRPDDRSRRLGKGGFASPGGRPFPSFREGDSAALPSVAAAMRQSGKPVPSSRSHP